MKKILTSLVFISTVGFCLNSDDGAIAAKNGDYKKAFEWYEKSANQGYPNAQNNLAIYYSEGRLGNKDDSKAEKLFKQACDGGLDYAYNNYEMILNARGFSVINKKYLLKAFNN